MLRRQLERTGKTSKEVGRSRRPRFSSGSSSKVLLNEGQEINVLMDDISRVDGISKVRGLPTRDIEANV
jgi:hypothetical protein